MKILGSLQLEIKALQWTYHSNLRYTVGVHKTLQFKSQVFMNTDKLFYEPFLTFCYEWFIN